MPDILARDGEPTEDLAGEQGIAQLAEVGPQLAPVEGDRPQCTAALVGTRNGAEVVGRIGHHLDLHGTARHKIVECLGRRRDIGLEACRIGPALGG